MKMTKFYAPLAALLLTGAAFTSCSSDDAKSEVVPASKNWSLSIGATAPGLDTRALTYGGVENQSVISKWQLGETMEVYNITQNSTVCRGKLTPKTGNLQQDFLVTTAEGLTGGFAMGDVLKIYYPTKNVTYLNQDGTFETLSLKYDYSDVSVNITDIDETNKALKATSAQGDFAAQFVNKQAIVKFNLTVDGVPFNASELTVSGIDNNENDALVKFIDENGQAVLGDIPVVLASASSEVWVAISSNVNVTLTLTASAPAVSAPTRAYGGPQIYTATTQTPVQFENGKFYSIDVPLHPVEAGQGTGN